MSDAVAKQELAAARENIRALQAELAETNRGVTALALELETRVDERTAELRAAHTELEKTNSELLQLTLELEDRVAQRTRELQASTEEVRTMTEQLWQTAKLATVGELGASIAHELNNPLATVSLHIEALLERTGEAGPERHSLRLIEQETERMANLVANLLEFSRRSSMQASTIDVRAEINDSLELVNHHLRKRGIRVACDFTADLPEICADRQQLRQVFLNLFTNAADAMPQGGTLTVRVSSPATAANGAGGPERQVVIEVTDTGSGIAPEDLERVFEPFFTTKPAGKGTGLGLPICRRIVQEHGGTLDLISAVGKGTSVRVVLPTTNKHNWASLVAD